MILNYHPILHNFAPTSNLGKIFKAQYLNLSLVTIFCKFIKIIKQYQPFFEFIKREKVQYFEKRLVVTNQTYICMLKASYKRYIYIEKCNTKIPKFEDSKSQILVFFDISREWRLRLENRIDSLDFRLVCLNEAYSYLIYISQSKIQKN